MQEHVKNVQYMRVTYDTTDRLDCRIYQKLRISHQIFDTYQLTERLHYHLTNFLTAVNGLRSRGKQLTYFVSNTQNKFFFLVILKRSP